MAESARQLRRDSVARIAEIAATSGRVHIDFDRLDEFIDNTLARPAALQVLVRQALRAAIGDQLLLEEIRMLFPVGRGEAVALDDAIHQHGLPQQTPTTGTHAVDTDTTEDLGQVLKEILT